MVAADCHCGAVTLQIVVAPVEVTSCACSICRRYGALWAYYAPHDVQIAGETDIYMWGDKMLELHRCKICGCVTHWAPVDKTRDCMGVNARLMPPEIAAAANLRHIEGPKERRNLL